jgi:hypothetical protein
MTNVKRGKSLEIHCTNIQLTAIIVRIEGELRWTHP